MILNGALWNDTKLVPFGTHTVFFLNITKAVESLCVYICPTGGPGFSISLQI